MRGAAETSTSGEVNWYQLTGAVAFEARFAKEPSLAADPASKRCIALADAQTKGQLKLALALQQEKSKLRDTFAETFARACKIDHAKIGENRLGEPGARRMMTQPVG